jgi:hypothetical protein
MPGISRAQLRPPRDCHCRYRRAILQQGGPRMNTQPLLSPDVPAAYLALATFQDQLSRLQTLASLPEHAALREPIIQLTRLSRPSSTPLPMASAPWTVPLTACNACLSCCTTPRTCRCQPTSWPGC